MATDNREEGPNVKSSFAESTEKEDSKSKNVEGIGIKGDSGEGTSIPETDFEKLVLGDKEDASNSNTGGDGSNDGKNNNDISEDKKKEDRLDDDYVDEEALKTEEEKLTSEEKAERLASAKTHKDTGNDEFKQEKYRESIYSYTKGLLVCPLCEKQLRSILYGNRAAAKIKLGHKDLAVMDCTKSLEYNPDYMKALIRRAALYEELEKLDEALEDYKKILTLDPSYRDAIIATQRLPAMINERNEKLKTEMLGKLKDLGNLVLRPFGLSTDNFQMEQQPGGGYSVNFKK